MGVRSQHLTLALSIFLFLISSGLNKVQMGKAIRESHEKKLVNDLKKLSKGFFLKNVEVRLDGED